MLKTAADECITTGPNREPRQLASCARRGQRVRSHHSHTNAPSSDLLLPTILQQRRGVLVRPDPPEQHGTPLGRHLDASDRDLA